MRRFLDPDLRPMISVFGQVKSAFRYKPPIGVAGGILLVTRLVDTDKSVPARLSPPTGAGQISEARRVSPTMSARGVCNLIDPWQKCSFSKPNIMVVDPKITTQAAAVSLCNEFVGAVRGMRKVGEPMEPGWTLHVPSNKGELASCYLP